MQCAELVAETFTAAGWEDRQGGFSFQDFRNDLSLSVPELVEAEDVLKCGQNRRIDGVQIIIPYYNKVIITFKSCVAYCLLSVLVPPNRVAVSTRNPYPRPMNRFLMILLLSIGAGCSFGQNQTPAKPSQFICVLRVIPRLYDDSAWTKDDNAVVEKHFARLKEAADRGEVILAGRTAESLDKTFGILVFEAKDQEAASEFVKEDPAVAAGLFTAELHPFSVALARKSSE
jgi:uncharacterized protein